MTPLPLVRYNQSRVFTRRDPMAAGGESSHDASKEVSDVLERRRRQDRQNAGRGFRLKLPETQQHDQAPKKHHLQPTEDVSSAEQRPASLVEQRPRRHQLPPTVSSAGRSTGEIQEVPGPRPLAPDLHITGEKTAAATSQSASTGEKRASAASRPSQGRRRISRDPNAPADLGGGHGPAPLP